MKKALRLIILFFLFLEIFIFCACNDNTVNTELDLDDLSIGAVDHINIPAGEYVLDFEIEKLDEYKSKFNVTVLLTVTDKEEKSVSVEGRTFIVREDEVYTCSIEVKRGNVILKSKTITVTAVASEVQSATTLSAPENISIDENAVISFDNVENCTEYKIMINTNEYISQTNSKSLKEILIYNGTYQIKVKALGDGTVYLNSVWSTSVEFNFTKGKIKLCAPENLDVSDLKILTFNIVSSAVSYLIDVNGTELSTINNEIDLSEYLSEPGTYVIKVMAKGNDTTIEDSLWSQNMEKIITYDATPVENFNFEINDGMATLTGFSETALANLNDFTTIVIPASYQSCPLTAIGASAFLSCDTLERVTFPNSLKIIGDCAFMNCSVLENIVWGRETELIGTDAFRYCSALSEIKIPDSVKSIGSFCFYYDTGLETVSLGTSLETIGEDAFGYTLKLTSFSVKTGNQNFTSVDGVLYSADKKNLVKYPAFKTGSTYSAEAATETVIKGAFASNTFLNSVNFGINLKEIADEAFLDCVNLTSVTILALVPPIIGIKVFKYESGLEFYTIAGLNINVTSSVVDTYRSAWSGYSAIIFEII